MEMDKGNFLLLQKCGECFVFVYTLETIEALVESIARYAKDDRLSLNWEDAAFLYATLLLENV